jgi:hypothetical protein
MAFSAESGLKNRSGTDVEKAARLCRDRFLANRGRMLGFANILKGIGAVTMRRDFAEVKPQRNARCGLA